MVALFSLGAFVGFDLIGFELFAILSLAYAFYGTVLKDKPLPKSEHQYFVLGLAGVLAFNLITFSLIYSLLVGAFLFAYMNKNSVIVKQLRELKNSLIGTKENVKEKNKEENKEY